MASDECQEGGAPFGGSRSIHRGPYPMGGKDSCLPDQELSPRAGEDPGERSTRLRRGEESGSELAEGKKSGLKKLVLTQEQKTSLLDWNDSNPESLHLEAGARLSQQSAENGRGGRALKPVRPLLLPRTVGETLPAQREAQEKMGTPAERAPGERSVAPPKSPLRLIANAIRRSLEPLLPSSDGGRKVWAKSELKALPTSPPHGTRSFSLWKSSSSKDRDQQSPKKDKASRASAFFSLGAPPTRAAQPSDLGPHDPALRTHSLPNRPSKMFPAFVSPSYSKMEDVPTLLEKVSLQETFPDASRVPKKKTSLFSSLRLKDKSFESFPQVSRPRKDLQDLFGSPKGKVLPVGSAQALEKLVPPVSSACLGQRLHAPSPEKGASPKHIPTSMQVTGAASSASSTTTSSADEEFDPQPSLRSKAIQRQLEEVEERQRASEIQGVRLEKALRGEAGRHPHRQIRSSGLGSVSVVRDQWHLGKTSRPCHLLWNFQRGPAMQINKEQETERVKSQTAAPKETKQKICKPGIEINTL
ncbi:MICAL C-terminal-like protein [Camelus ferus]|nr:MICAL C-terminal-like protein [Camelus ferus]